jgi:hypothetical protein
MVLQVFRQTTREMSWEWASLDAVLLMYSVCKDSLTDLKCDSGSISRLGSDPLIISEEMRKSCRIRWVMADWPCCSRAVDNRDRRHKMHESDRNETALITCDFQTVRLMRSKLYCGFLNDMRAVLNDRRGWTLVRNMERFLSDRVIPEFWRVFWVCISLVVNKFARVPFRAIRHFVKQEFMARKIRKTVTH